MVCVIGAMSLASCSEDSISPDAGGDGDGDSTTEVPLAQVAKPKPNPWLAQEEYSITHFNSAQTDAFSSAVKDGTFNIDLSKCQMTWSGPVNLMTLASTSPNYMWGMSSDRVSYLDISDGKLERVAEAGLPGITMKTQEQLTRIIADHATYDELSKTVTDILGPVPQMSFTLVGATMTYDGHLVVAAQNGLLVLNRALTTIEDSYPLPSDQILTNSICIDENGGVYVASNSRTPGGKGLMQKLICKDGKISTSQADGAWQAYYDGGPQAPCIKLGHGTGSTPTLMGFGQDKDKLVVITDGSKRMKLVAFWRDEIPSDAQQVAGYDKRIAGVHEVTCGLGTSTEWIQSEQSVVVGGYDAFVVNNINVTNQEINDKIIGVIAIGPIVKGPQGAECVRWNTKEKKWESKWTRSDVSSVSMIPAVSIKSEMVFVCGWNDASGWEVTGLDWKSGATRHRSILGKNNRANGAYAIIQYLANGDLLFNSVAGPIRVKY